MSQRATHLDQSTHTDLHYGLVPIAAGNSATLEPEVATRDISANEVSLTEINAASDKITQNAATRADSSLSSQIDAPEPSRIAARKASRWRYTDGIAPQPQAKVVTQPQFAVRDTQVQGSFRRWLYRTWLASLGWQTSFLVHLIMLPVLVLLSVPAVQRVWLPAFEATQDERIEVLEVAPPLQTAELPSTVEFRIARPMTMEVSLPDPKFERGALPSLLSVQPLTTSRTVAGPVSEIQQLFGKGGSGQSESGPGAGGAEFFGSKASGNKFVFVVDCSLSMQGERWQQACIELDAAITRLKPEQLFYVVLFDGGVHRMFNHDDREAALFPATDEIKQRCRDWLASARLGAETRPFLSVKCAVELRPDAIYLLSDGDFTDPTADYLKEVNRPFDHQRRPQPVVAVHTINFHGPRDKVTMKRIARENHGRYIFVGK